MSEDMDSDEFSPLNTGDFEPTNDFTTADINLATGDFESVVERSDGPRLPPKKR